ncbi:MAG: PTS sugar transporter subunit IIC [Clostridia bacterium]|nr:PTS sugar transporter subunit IIC [Clostridia bacterium]
MEEQPAFTEETSSCPEESSPQKSSRKKAAWQKTKKILSYIFIDGLAGMATGLFATLIIGTIICQIGSFIPGKIGYFIGAVGTLTKLAMGFGIGLGVAYKLKKPPLAAISAGVAGLIGAFASQIIKGTMFAGALTTFVSVGEPLGAFIAAFVALETGSLVAGKTKVDIIVTPLVAITCGSIVGLLLGPPISTFMGWLGNIINVSAQQQPVLMGILVAAIMGTCLTLPISSAAIGVSLGLSGIAAGAAVVGCCAHMVGFAVMSFRENKWGGLVAQGVGTSMLQMPNLIKHPVCWLPPIVTSAILGPIAAVCGIASSPVGSGMGTAGLVGPIETFMTMYPTVGVPLTLLFISLFCIVLPAALCLLFSEIMRKIGWIKSGDLKLDL